MSKNTFLMHKRDIWVSNKLNREQLGELFSMILRWQNAEKDQRKLIVSDDPMVELVFGMFTERFINDELEYERICQVRRENGRQGGVANATKSKQMLPNATKSKQDQANLIQSYPIPSNKEIDILDKSRIEVVPSNSDIEGGIEGKPRARENWRALSSVRKDSLGWDKDAIAEFKKNLLRQEVEELGVLTEEGVVAFVSKWGEHNPGSDIIRAEMEPVFDVAERARNYASIGRATFTTAPTKEPERFEEGKYYWLRSFTKEDLQAMDFEVRRHVQRQGAVKRVNGKWVID
jgi:hypothetical protein